MVVFLSRDPEFLGMKRSNKHISLPCGNNMTVNVCYFLINLDVTVLPSVFTAIKYIPAGR
jgi:hypothetical protein